jgi:hypothetical protein
MLGCPVVVNYRGGEAQSSFARPFFWVERTLRRANGLVFPSGFVQQIFRQNYCWSHVGRKSLEFCWTGLDVFAAK